MIFARQSKKIVGKKLQTLGIDMDNKFKILQSTEVVTVESINKIVMSHCTFRVGELLEALIVRCKNDVLSNAAGKYRDSLESWFNKGIDCEVMSLSKGWQKGKIRIKVTLEFCPNEPEIEEPDAINHTKNNQVKSPLDDIRQMVNGNS